MQFPPHFELIKFLRCMTGFLMWFERECFCWLPLLLLRLLSDLSVLFTSCTFRHKKLRWWWLKELLKFAICYFAAFSSKLSLMYPSKLQRKSLTRWTKPEDECSIKVRRERRVCEDVNDGMHRMLVELEKITAPHQKAETTACFTWCRRKRFIRARSAWI